MGSSARFNQSRDWTDQARLPAKRGDGQHERMEDRKLPRQRDCIAALRSGEVGVVSRTLRLILVRTKSAVTKESREDKDSASYILPINCLVGSSHGDMIHSDCD